MAEVPKSDSSVACELRSWAVNSMQFTAKDIDGSVKLPSAKDFQLICRGQMNDIWQFVINRVHSCQTVRNIKGNLALKRLQNTVGKFEKSADLNEEQRLVMRDAEAVISSSQQLEHDIDSLQQQILATEKAYRESVHTMNDVRHRTMLLKSFSHSTSEDLELIKELTGRVQHTLHNFENAKEKQSAEPSSDVSFAVSDATVGGLETACLKAVRQTCDLIARFLHKLLRGGFDNDQNDLNQSKNELWIAVQSVLSTYSASDILSSLSVHADNTSITLRHKTASVNVLKDAERLRFKYEAGGRLSDLCVEPSVLHSVHQLLEVSQAAAFARFIETENYRNEAGKLQSRLAEASSLVDKMLCQQFSASDRLQLARSLVEAETCVASTKTAIKTLVVVSDDLSKKIKQAITDKEILYEKYQKIQDFKKLTDMKQNLIRVLVKQNMNARSRLVNQQLENMSYADSSLAGHDSGLNQLVELLKDFVLRETDSFMRLALPMLPNITLHSEHKMSVVDLSIHKLDHLSHVSNAQLIIKILQKANLASVAPDYLLQRIAELQTETNRIGLMLRCSTNAGSSMSQRVIELCLDVNKHDEQTIERLLPVLRKRLTGATQTLADCLQIKDYAADWWDQPGQFCSPWVTVDGFTLKQWRDKWTVSATRLRQLPIRTH